jgi:hypothetical protein
VKIEGKVIVLDGDGERHEINLGGHGQGHAFVIGGDGDEGGKVRKRIEIRRQGGGEGGEGGGQFFMEGDGLKKQRGMGGEGGEPHVFVEGGKDGERRIEIRRQGGHGGEMPGFFHMDGGGTGKVIIITPDGQRREFNFGGPGDGKHVQIQPFGDGEAPAAHLDGQGDRVFRVRRTTRGSAL